MSNLPLTVAPGIILSESIFSEPGRWVDGSNVRWVRGKPQKIGGNDYYSSDTYTGTARAILAWSDYSSNSLVAVGTDCKLNLYDTNGNVSDITPYSETGTLNNPFAVEIGETRVQVAHNSHGRTVGSFVTFSNATDVGGLDMNGEWQITAVTSTSVYEFEHTSAATSNDTGGGTVDYDYELNCGNTDAVTGGGFGIGGFGTGTYGDARDSDFVQQPRMWALAQYGEDLLALPSKGDLYYYDTSAGGRATNTPVSNAPTNNQWMYVAQSRHVILIGADDDPMLVQWPDQDDINEYTPAADNSAGQRRLQDGSKLIAGGQWSGFSDIIWSDTAAVLWRYTGGQNVFANELIATGCGLVGPEAFTMANGVAYWRSRNNFYQYNGYFSPMPNAENIRDFVNEQVSELQVYKTFAGHNTEYNEVWFWFVVEGDTEPSIWVMFDVNSQEWSKGTMNHSAFTNQENAGSQPLMTGTGIDDFVYVHETGKNEADGTPIEAYLTMAPVTYGNGANAMDIERFEPDFETQEGPMRIRITTYSRSRENSVLECLYYTLADTDDGIDLRAAGRYVDVQFYTNEVDGDFRFGSPKLEIELAGTRQ